ncbi:MAG TPA: N-acetylglucosamine-6-phosphate deacetylase [Clostridiaceae bacterium]|nr:N-acetylglucosamine-6-phosphate deacetylase [Clostridiaceae bacterium]
MWIKNALVLDSDFTFQKKDILIEGNTISDIVDRTQFHNIDLHNRMKEKNQEYYPVIDLTGLKLIPGLIDVHIHGCGGADATRGGDEALETISSYLAARGVTCFLATSFTVPVEMIFEFIKRAKTQADNLSGARLGGVHLEGPFLSEVYKGAHDSKYLLKPDKRLFGEWLNAGDGMIKMITIAPELPGADKVIELAVENNVCVSGGHTASNYDEMCRAIDLGVSHATHLYNAMPQLDRRNPGPVAALLEKDTVVCEIIGDFRHVHPVMVDLTWRMKQGKMLLVSDCMEAAGMPDGEYDFYNERKIIRNGLAYTENGVISGSTSTIIDCVKNLVSIGIPIEEAVKAASIIPAKEAGIDAFTGSIAKGKLADLVAVDDNLNPCYCWVGGKLVYKK